MAEHATPGTTTRLIVAYVRNRAGDEGVSEMLLRARLPHDLSKLIDEAAWFSYEEKIALFDAASDVLDDPDIGRHVGESIFGSDNRAVVPVLRALGSSRAVLQALIDSSSSFSPIADMSMSDAAEHEATIHYRLHDGHQPSRHDCGYTIGLLTRVATIFNLPPATVDHDQCQVDGADECVYRVRWTSAPPKPRRLLPRRSRRDHVRSLSTRFWELEGATLDLVSDGDPSTILTVIAKRAADAVGAADHVLVVTDPDGSMPSVIRHGLVGGTAALVDSALGGLVDDDDPTRIVAELASDRRRYGHLIVIFDDSHESVPEERTILRTYARHAAMALDAAAAITAARIREETASVLLELARSLADLTSVDEVAARVAELAPTVTGAHQAAVMLWDPARRSLRVRASAGVLPDLQAEVDELEIPIDPVADEMPSSVGWEPTILPRAAAQGLIAEIMDRHCEAAIGLIPLRVRGKLHGMIALGWRTADIGPRDVLLERLTAVADQAATALENATLLEQVRHQALHDGLTGLPNQTLFADRVSTEITRARRNGARVAVGVLDLDRFKTVNDSLGHGAGDQLLVQVTDRLGHAVRAPDTIARMGGDEFTLLLPDVTDGGETIVAERILEAFVQPFEIEGHRLRISPSIGIAVYPDDGDSFQQLLRCADVAMYRAKERGRNTWALYASGMAERAYDRLTLETDLYRALQRRELRVAFQPLLRLDDGQVIGTEALVRWAHPSLGLLTPDEFLPIAEDLGLMAEIDGWVLRQACVELGNALATGTDLTTVSVNLSARTLSHPALERLVADALAAGGIDPRRLVIEISESVTAERTLAIADALRGLRSRGVRVALDNFGRGSSALSRLEHLPIDQLKVDGQFLASIDEPDVSAPVVEAIVAMGHGLGLEVVAEGVETETQRAFAARLGFDLAQGWFVGRPVSELDYAGARSRTA